MEQKKAAWDKQEKDYQAQQKEIARLMEIVEKFKNKSDRNTTDQIWEKH